MLEAAELKSSSESIVFDVEVRGVGGAASGPAEANLLGSEPLDIVASAAVRFLAGRGMVRPRGDARQDKVTSTTLLEGGKERQGPGSRSGEREARDDSVRRPRPTGSLSAACEARARAIR